LSLHPACPNSRPKRENQQGEFAQFIFSPCLIVQRKKVALSPQGRFG
jgi:hypothetical protein